MGNASGMEPAPRTKLARSLATVLATALLCLGSFVYVPLPDGIPITVQNMFAALSGLVLGGLQGAGAVGLFLIAGAAGLPVFAGCRGGMAVLQGPTGGFLIGYFAAALAGGLVIGSPLAGERKSQPFLLRLFLAALVAFALPYLFGIPRFMAAMEAAGSARTVRQALSAALLPFIPGDVLKLLLCMGLSLVLRPLAARRLYPDDDREAADLLQKLEARTAKGR